MSTNFQIDVKKSNGQLHLIPRGDLDGSSAWELLNFLTDHCSDQGSVVIDTSRLRRVHPFGCATFKGCLALTRFSADRLVFKGDKGVALAPGRSKVMVASEAPTCRCKGNCKQCKCLETANMKSEASK